MKNILLIPNICTLEILAIILNLKLNKLFCAIVRYIASIFQDDKLPQLLHICTKEASCLTMWKECLTKNVTLYEKL